MEESENLKPWHLTHEDERLGPFSMEELKAKAELGEVSPRLDKVWKEGMENWIPAGELEGLFKKNAEAEVVEKKKETVDLSDYYQDDDEEERRHDEDKWPGTSRSGFIFFCFIFPVLWLVGIAYAYRFLNGKLDPTLLNPISIVLSLLPIPIALMSILQRFQNLGMSRLWFFGLLVPLLNWWLGYRLFACPKGYTEYKKLGIIGWFLAIIYWLPLFAAMGLGVFCSIKGTEFLDKFMDENLSKYEEAVRAKVEELSEAPESEEAKKAVEKGPSIIPVR